MVSGNTDWSADKSDDLPHNRLVGRQIGWLADESVGSAWFESILLDWRESWLDVLCSVRFGSVNHSVRFGSANHSVRFGSVNYSVRFGPVRLAVRLGRYYGLGLRVERSAWPPNP